jgi:hypothetical protein
VCDDGYVSGSVSNSHLGLGGGGQRGGSDDGSSHGDDEDKGLDQAARGRGELRENGGKLLSVCFILLG